MARTSVSAAARRIQIEDEVWEHAFSSRVPARRGRDSGRSNLSAPARPSLPSDDRAGLPSRERPRLRVAPAVDHPGTAEPEPIFSTDGPPPGLRPASGEGRRTVRIQGRGADPFRSYAAARPQARPASTLHRSIGGSPDRLALWATLLGFLLVVVAILSSHF